MNFVELVTYVICSRTAVGLGTTCDQAIFEDLRELTLFKHYCVVELP